MGLSSKVLHPRFLIPLYRYRLNPRADLNELEKGMPWRTVKDEFGKFKRIDNEGRTYQGTPYSVEPDATARQIFVASMMHTSVKSPALSETPDVTCPSDAPDSEGRKEVVHHEEIPGYSKSKQKKNASDKESNFTTKAKSIPVTPKTVASSTGPMREQWLVCIYKEIENLWQNMAIKDADPSLIVKSKSLGKWPLVFVLKPLTQTQQTADDIDQDYKHKIKSSGHFVATSLHGEST